MLKPVMASTKYRKASIFGKDAMSPILQCAGMYSTVPNVPTSLGYGILHAPSLLIPAHAVRLPTRKLSGSAFMVFIINLTLI
jgi:hypothetical protein